MELVESPLGRSPRGRGTDGREKLVAIGPDGLFAVTVSLARGENRFTFTATDEAGNEATAVGAVVRGVPPSPPQGLFGLGDLQYLVLVAFLAAGIAGTFLLMRATRKGEA